METRHNQLPAVIPNGHHAGFHQHPVIQRRIGQRVEFDGFTFSIVVPNGELGANAVHRADT